ncbi:MAG: pentapeptide repeat-containing protein [Bacteroidales bacterium]|nr:pentapeptide repeat-containing protein [Bacteroidales bacterium]
MDFRIRQPYYIRNKANFRQSDFRRSNFRRSNFRMRQSYQIL